MHVICNNQVGFTTTPKKGRSSNYSSDLAKTIGAPIFHVNANSVEDVCFVFKVAAEYRQKFQKDVVIDLIGYRKFGHNELDQPSFTNPMMYQKVSQMTPVARIYEQQLLDQGHLTQAELDQRKATISKHLEDAYVKSKSLTYNLEDWKTEEWGSI